MKNDLEVNMPVKILVVDDEPDLEHIIRQKFRWKIRDGVYEFHFAQNGEEALEKLRGDSSINLLLTDINMPVMDGLTLLSNVNNLTDRVLKSIIISAYGDMENIRIAMNRGAFDFVTKPIDLNDLEITMEKSLKEIEIYKQALSTQNSFTAIKTEIAIATAIQTSILPKSKPAFPDRKEFDIQAKMLTCTEVGGDLYDYFMIDKFRLGVIIGDVSGKGIAAAMLMAICKTLLKATALKCIPADTSLTEVNKILAEESPDNMFVTVFYGVLDIRNGRFEYSNAGHNLPYLISGGSIRQLENIGGLLLGAFKNIEYESNVVVMKPGDTLFFYTDGVTEAMNEMEEEFGEKKLEKCLSNINGSATGEILDRVITMVKEYSGKAQQADDITCMALRYN